MAMYASRLSLVAAVMLAVLATSSRSEAGPDLERILVFAAQETRDPAIIEAVQVLREKGFLKRTLDDASVAATDTAGPEATIARVRSSMDSYLKTHKTRAGHGEYYAVLSWSIQSIDWKAGDNEARVQVVVSFRRGAFRSTESAPRSFSVNTEAWTISPLR